MPASVPSDIPPDPLRQSSRHRGLLLLGLLVGLGLRLYRLGAESLWYDETVSVFLASKSIPELLAHTAGDIHPPGYYLLLHGWRALAQPSVAFGLEFLYAWPSLFCGVLIGALTYSIARRLTDPRVALVALWLTAINPFHLWYSQEVRMYTLGAACGMVCFWALILYYSQFTSLKTVNKSALIVHSTTAVPAAAYVLAAAVGLYTLYYFAFLLIALNVIALLMLWQLWKVNVIDTFNAAIGWLGTQIVAFLLWLPWFPIFWRQATDPPVPPWRTMPTSIWEVLRDISESLGLLFIGQSAPGAGAWQWGIFALITFLIARAYHRSHAVSDAAFPTRLAQRHSALPTPYSLLLLYILIPIAALHLLTLTVTPLYFARYVFTYAPPFTILLAMAICQGLSTQRWRIVARISIVAVLCGLSIANFWFAPRFRADTHRTAVASLAGGWRPGDVILANAGWSYTALTTYWPTVATSVTDAVPPPLADIVRLTAYTGSSEEMPDLTAGPVVVRTGSVDGAANLGWGSPNSDFFAMSAAATAAAIATLATNANRIWHYRIYDTVNDPQGLIRKELLANATLGNELPFGGRDFLLGQVFVTPPSASEGALPVPDNVDFGTVLRLHAHDAPAVVTAGQILYASLLWEALPDLVSLPTHLNMSLRLYHSRDELLRQHDEEPTVSTTQWQEGQRVQQPLAVAVPISAKPGTYTLELVVYRADDGAPLALPDSDRTMYGQRWQLSTVDIVPTTEAPRFPTKLARFDYIDLIDATVDRTALNAGESLTVKLYWQPQDSLTKIRTRQLWNCGMQRVMSSNHGRMSWAATTIPAACGRRARRSGRQEDWPSMARYRPAPIKWRSDWNEPAMACPLPQSMLSGRFHSRR